MSLFHRPTLLRMLLVALFLAPAAASAQTRAGHNEVSFQLRSTGSESIGFQNGSVANLGPTTGFGVGFAHHFDDRKSVGVDFTWNNADNSYTGTSSAGGAPLNYNATGYSSSLLFNGTYHLFEGPITPYVTGFLGGTYFDTGIPDGVGTGCYWYAWYGYVCGPILYSKTSTNLTYGAGVGVRWDVTSRFFVKLGVQQQWWQVGGASGTPDITAARFDFGMKF